MPPTPMPNLGNTCYMNASLQLLTLVDWSRSPSPHVHKLADVHHVKQAIARHQACFSGTRQHDAHEFIVAFLDMVDPKLQSLHYGTMSSFVKCNSTDEESSVNEPFLVISVPLPTQRVHIDLDDCIHELQEEEILRGENVWMSPESQKRQLTPISSTKGMRIIRWPKKEVVFHLKRFKNDRTKINQPVSCPLRWNGRRLTAFVIHQGVYGGGHYISVVRQGDQWFVCNDSHISALSEAQVQSMLLQSYILLYSSAA